MSEGHFNQGEAYYRAGEWSKARTEFQASYEISRLDLLLFNIAQTYIKEGDSVRAIAALKAYLKTTPSVSIHAPPNRKERPSVLPSGKGLYLFQSMPLPTGRSDLRRSVALCDNRQFQSTPLPTGRSD